MLAIVKEMQGMMVGDKKVMVFTPGYGHISIFDSLLAPDNQHLKPWTTTYSTLLSGLRILVPSALTPTSLTAAYHAPMLLYLIAISWAVRLSLFIAPTSAPASSRLGAAGRCNSYSRQKPLSAMQ